MKLLSVICYREILIIVFILTDETVIKSYLERYMRKVEKSHILVKCVALLFHPYHLWSGMKKKSQINHILVKCVAVLFSQKLSWLKHMRPQTQERRHTVFKYVDLRFHFRFKVSGFKSPDIWLGCNERKQKVYIKDDGRQTQIIFLKHNALSEIIVLTQLRRKLYYFLCVHQGKCFLYVVISALKRYAAFLIYN